MSFMTRCALGIATLLVAFAPAAGAAAEVAASKGKPNILFILADDYGIDGVGCYGSDRFKNTTPHIDALAKAGTRFDRCYAAPVCGPTRVMFITGRYAFRTGGLSNGSSSRPRATDEPSVARIIKQAGYVTGMAGKWRQMTGLASDWGFDEYQMTDTPSGPSSIKSYTENGKVIPRDPQVFYPDVHHAFALEFVRKHRERPFFFYYSTHLVHDPVRPTPDSKPGADQTTQYNDNVAYLDKQVGELVAEIERLGLRERTLIIFAADNGTDAGGRSSTVNGRKLSGGKRTMLEGGANVPFIASWKGVIPAGRVSRDLIDFSDLLPTFAEVAGGKVPEGITFDGRSFLPQLRGEPGNPREWAYVQLFHDMDHSKFPVGRYYVRGDRWKLNESGELFGMKDAPFEETLVPADTTDSDAVAARKQLAAVLAELNPGAGKTEPLPRKARP